MGKKAKFDPLGGSISGGSIPKQKKSRKNKSPDILTGGRKNAKSDLYPEDYSRERYAGSDALTPSGEKNRKKKGFFARLFGGGKKPAPQKIPPVPEPAEMVEPVPEEEDLFEEEEAPVLEIREEPQETEPSPADGVRDPNTCALCGFRSETGLPHFTMQPGSTVPLCRTCFRAVDTLMNHRDPAEEEEICGEWSTLCPGLDPDLATRVVLEGRNYH
jgi:ribosomal protein S14